MKKLILILIISTLFTLSCIFTAFAQKQTVKEPNVSGSFYPADAIILSSMIEDLLGKAEPFITKAHIWGMIAPHAGYIYSGSIAAKAYKSIYKKNYSTVIILAPSHYHNLKKAAVYKDGIFKTPLGQVSVDSDFTKKLLKNSLYFEYKPRVFEKEHSIEVQLPFLQKSLNNFSIVPIIIFKNSYSYYDSIADILAALISDREDVLLIASSDMSHFHSQEKANLIDRNTLSFISSNDSAALFDNLRTGDCELCGDAAVITLMLTMKKIKAEHRQILDYSTSADTTNSSPERVVGYSSVIYSKALNEKTNIIPKRSKDMLTYTQKSELLAMARKSIKDYLKSGERQTIKTDDPLFLEKRGAFVTLSKNGMLRGCIGRIVSDIPLIRVIRDMAIEAATSDPRFPAVSEQELESLDLEISVMSPIEEITDISKIKVGTHGIIISKEYHSGLLLPQVATEYGWNTEQFLEQTCVKAGLNRDEWKKGAKIFIFSAEVFKELD